jgi:hypothetical protein
LRSRACCHTPVGEMGWLGVLLAAAVLAAPVLTACSTGSPSDAPPPGFDPDVYPAPEAFRESVGLSGGCPAVAGLEEVTLTLEDAVAWLGAYAVGDSDGRRRLTDRSYWNFPPSLERATINQLRVRAGPASESPYAARNRLRPRPGRPQRGAQAVPRGMRHEGRQRQPRELLVPGPPRGTLAALARVLTRALDAVVGILKLCIIYNRYLVSGTKGDAARRASRTAHRGRAPGSLP